ncbi:HalOD1 output domain-containing protein [Halomarina rubra]|uniref:HalOD1 output domain-containing protein n=2 Tax=Halomarina rubra TaxID=2071873 RepID=A0ABD6AS04_9EURY
MSCFRRIDGAASTAVVEAVASAEGVPPRTLDPLYDTIDPDALDALVSDAGPVRIRFSYEGHTVTVHGDGRLELEETAATTVTDADPSAASD